MGQPREPLTHIPSRTANEWAQINVVLGKGLPGHEKDTNYLKVGDGKTPWNSLDYVTMPGGEGGGNGGGGADLDAISFQYRRFVDVVDTADWMPANSVGKDGDGCILDLNYTEEGPLGQVKHIVYLIHKDSGQWTVDSVFSFGNAEDTQVALNQANTAVTQAGQANASVSAVAGEVSAMESRLEALENTPGPDLSTYATVASVQSMLDALDSEFIDTDELAAALSGLGGSESAKYEGDYSSTKTYKQGSVVRYNGVAWGATLADITANQTPGAQAVINYPFVGVYAFPQTAVPGPVDGGIDLSEPLVVPPGGRSMYSPPGGDDVARVYVFDCTSSGYYRVFIPSGAGYVVITNSAGNRQNSAPSGNDMTQYFQAGQRYFLLVQNGTGGTLTFGPRDNETEALPTFSNPQMSGIWEKLFDIDLSNYVTSQELEDAVGSVESGGPSARADFVAAFGSAIAAGASDKVGAAPQGSAHAFFKVKSSHPGRVRLYPRESDWTADQNRAVGEDPVVPCFMDLVFTAVDQTVLLAPVPMGYLDTHSGSGYTLAFTNSGGGGVTPTITLTFLQLES